MEYAVYKPYKKRRDTWNSVTDRQKDVDGRKLLCIEIGKKQILNEETQEKIHYMSYENLLAVAEKVLINRGKKAKNGSEENDLKEELFYRFIQGELS